MDNLFLNFFLPAVNGSIHSILQLVFAVSFAAAVFLVPRAVGRAANSGQWQRNFDALEQTGAGPTAITSVDELASAVATPSERWADVLPSLLLVFGLLGTFIGLGLALTEAAGALGPGSDALANLTPIMDSLGSKFKTSTWGILAFLGLKVWFTLKPYDERRQAWAASKVQSFAARASEQERQQRNLERSELIEAIGRHRDSVQESHQSALERASQHHEAQLVALKQQTDRQRRLGEQQLEQGGLQLHVLKELCSQVEQAATRDGALLARLDTIAGYGADTLDRLATVADHSAASRVAMEEFSHSVGDNIQNMAKAAGEMALAAQAAGNASTHLSGAVGEFREAMTTVLGDVKADLGGMIAAMGTTFADNMEKMSTNLKSATDGIEAAIGTLSAGVKDTITQLQQTSDAAADRHEKARVVFTNSGDSLAKQIDQMGEFMKKLGAQVDIGLNSVATANLRMRALDAHFDEHIKRADAMLAAMTKVSTSIADAADQMNVTERELALLTPVAERIQGLVQAIDKQNARQVASHEQQQKQATENARVLAAIDILREAIVGIQKVTGVPAMSEQAA